MVLRLHKAEAWLKNSRLQAYTYAVAFGFVGYAVLALTDYQLDVTAIWVALAVGIALLATIAHLVQSGDGNSTDMRRSKWLLAAPALLVLLSALVYLPPVLLARVAFYDGVTELYERNIPAFLANATRATELTPWEAHYANQVAIELGNAALATQDAELASRLRSGAEQWFARSLAVNPDQEFCHFNLGWLLLKSDPARAIHHFQSAARLVPDKRGVYFGLGLGYMGQQQRENVIQAFALECLSDPAFLISPVFQQPALRGAFPAVAARLDQLYTELLAESGLGTEKRRELEYGQLQSRWLLRKAELSPLLLELAGEDRAAALKGKPRKDSQQAWHYLHAAWSDPTRAPTRVRQAWAVAMGEIPNQPIIEAMVQRLGPGERPWLDVLRVASETVPQDGSPLLGSIRRERPAHRIFARNLDASVPSDLYSFTSDDATEPFFGFLFRSRAAAPASYLLRQSLAR
jgi:tetratricopeptide (TPR) repeat protein